MAAPIPTALIPIYASFRVIIMNLKNRTDVEESLEKLILMRFNSKMAWDFDLKRILTLMPIDEKNEKLNEHRKMILAKIERLAQEALKMEVSDSSDDEEAPVKKPSLEAFKPLNLGETPAKTAPSRPKLIIRVPNPKLIIKVANPFHPKNAPITVTGSRIPKKRKLRTAAELLLDMGITIEK
ncbi:unnamed protein product [Caenorhabditis brenneri]